MQRHHTKLIKKRKTNKTTESPSQQYTNMVNLWTPIVTPPTTSLNFMKGVFIIYTYFYPAIGCNFRDGGSTGHKQDSGGGGQSSVTGNRQTDKQTDEQRNR